MMPKPIDYRCIMILRKPREVPRGRVEPSERALGVELVGGPASESTGASSGSIPVRSARRRSVIRSRGVPGVGARSLRRQLFARMVTDDRQGLGAIKNRSAQA